MKIINNKILLFAFFILLTACSNYERVQPPKNIKVNPNPSEKYLVTMSAVESVFPIHDVIATTIYFVETDNLRKCSPIDMGRSIGGSWNSIDKNIVSKLIPTLDNQYQVIFVPNYFLDEAYYHMDVCHWVTWGVNFQFTRENISYSATMRYENILDENNVTLQCETLKNVKNRESIGQRNCMIQDENNISVNYPVFVLSIKSKKIL